MNFFEQAKQAQTDSLLNDLDPEFSLKDGLLIRCTVAEITGTKAELDAVTQAEALKSDDVREVLPWYDGISMTLLFTAYTPEDGVERLLWEVKDGQMIHHYSEPHYYTHFEKVTAADVERGYLRVYNDVQETMKVGNLPKDFSSRAPIQRFAYWLELISRKFGSSSFLTEGDGFYAVLRREPGKAGTQYEKKTFTRLVKSATIDGITIEAPWAAAPTLPQSDVRIALAALNREREARANAASNGNQPF